MKKRPTDNKSQSSASEQRNYTSGTLPKRSNTLQSCVLAALLEGRVITGIEAVFEQSTTRASAVVHALQRNYGWTIERHEQAQGTNDGRVSWIAVYWLSAQVREAAFVAGAAARRRAAQRGQARGERGGGDRSTLAGNRRS